MFPDPTVPVDAVMPATIQTILIIVTGLTTVCFFGYAIYESRRRRDLVPLYMVLGAGLAMVWEPVGDHLIKAYYPENGQITLFSAFGRDIPLFIGLIFFPMMSLGALWLLRASKRGFTPKKWWGVFAGTAAGLILFEILLLGVLGKFAGMGQAWIYYGNQPTKVLETPIMSLLGDRIGFICVMAVGAVALARFLPRRRQWLIVPGMMALFIGGNTMMTFPLALGLYEGGNSELLANLGGLGTLGMALFAGYIGYLTLRKPWPAEHPEVAQHDEMKPVALEA